MKTTSNFQMVAKTMAELEEVLAEELIALGAQNVEIGNRMVSFTGDNAMLYKANLHCRTALRILKPIHTFVANNADEVYEEIKKIDWDKYLTLENTFSIDAVVFSHIFRHSKFVAYRVKDGLVDYFSEKYNKRPSVSVTNPDLVFNIHIAHNKCTLSLDSSGESLHKRGYRIAQTEAPLNEVLAAGMLLKSGWRGESNFIDPMCGSGTLLIEAAMIALNMPPGIHREKFAFEKWPDFDSDLFSDIYNDDSGAKSFEYQIIGTDISAKAISIAEKNVKNAGLKNIISLAVKPFQQYTEAPQPAGMIMMNPPYGERIRVSDIEALYNMIGERLKHVFTGYDAYVLSYKKENFDGIGLKPSKRFFLFNGALECEMRHYEIFAGKRDDRPKQGKSTTRDVREARSVGENRREFKQEFSSKRTERRGERSEKGNQRRRNFKNKGEGYDKETPRRDNKFDNRQNDFVDDFASRSLFVKSNKEESQSEKKLIDLKKRKSEQSNETPGAERRVNKVFVARKRHRVKKDANRHPKGDNK